MFRGIFLVVAVSTLVFNRRAVIGTVTLGALFLFWYTRSSSLTFWGMSLRQRYLLGVLIGIAAIIVHPLPQGPTVQEQSILLNGQIVDQRTVDTYGFRMDDKDYVLQTSAFLEPGVTIKGIARFTPASTPSLSRSHLYTPPFLSGAFAFERRLAMKGYQGRLFAYPNQLKTQQQHPLPVLYNVRQDIKKAIYKHFPDRQLQALILGLVTGDRSGFTKEEYQTFIASGLAHLLAVSGSNIIYVTLLCSLILFFVPFYLRTVLVGAAIICYGVLCGGDSSVIRAVIMGVLGLIAILSGRIVDLRRLVYLAAGSMLLRNPLLLRYDLGFLLSFGAVLGIVWLAQWRHVYCPPTLSIGFSRIVSSYLLPTLGASLGVYPVLILFTGSISLSSLLLNLVVVPLVPLFLLFALVAFVTGRGRVYLLLERATTALFESSIFFSKTGLFLSVHGLIGKLSISILLFVLLRYISFAARQRKLDPTATEVTYLPT